MSEEAGGFQNGSSNVSSIPVLGLAEVSCIFNAKNPIGFLYILPCQVRWNRLSVPEVNLSLERLDYLKFPGIVKLLNKRVLTSVGLKSSSFFCYHVGIYDDDSHVLIPVGV